MHIRGLWPANINESVKISDIALVLYMAHAVTESSKLLLSSWIESVLVN